jgi:hypothetical protein
MRFMVLMIPGDKNFEAGAMPDEKLIAAMMKYNEALAETKELIGGYWLWQVKSKAEAIEWASRCPAADGDTLEIRQVFEAADFGPEVARKEAELMEQIGARVGANKREQVK